MLDEVYEWTKEYIQKVSESSEFNGESVFFDFEDFDSFDLVQMIEAAETRFNFRFEDSDFENPRFTTVNGFSSIVKSKLGFL
jgi:acyl carrier protein